jgi:hypothetical protein
MINNLSNKVNRFFSLRDKLSRSVEKNLKSYGDIEIIEIKAFRTPLNSILRKAINFLDGILTKGALQKEIKNKGYDELYHLGILITLKGGAKFIFEKNEEIEINNNLKSLNELTEYKDINIYNGLTMNKLLKNAISKFGERRLFVYDAFNFNCQRFIIDILEANNLLTPDLEAFINQNVESLINDTTIKLQRYAKGATNTKAWINKIIGKGKPKDKTLYNDIKKKIYKKIPKHSLYRSALIQKEYKKKGGEYIDTEHNNKLNIPLWFNQKWISINDYVRGDIVECGNNTAEQYNEYPLCRPLEIVNKISNNDLKRMIAEKNKLKNKPLRTKKVLGTDRYNIKPTNTGTF